jgi:hypothetical protein
MRPDDKQLADYLVLLGIFGKLAYPRVNVKKLIGAEKMKESKFYQEILAEGEAVGVLKAMRADILRVLRARFRSEPPAEVAAALDALDRVESLETLLVQAVKCRCLDKFCAAVLTQGSGR